MKAPFHHLRHIVSETERGVEKVHFKKNQESYARKQDESANCIF